MSNCFVSIIVPVYNKEKYLVECIESIIKQTYFKNIELILINDGSIDNSENICNRYCNKYKNIKYFYQENQGVSVARNNGMTKAMGKYLFFMDADDCIEEHFIENATLNAESNNSDIVIVANNVGLRNATLDKIYSLAIWQCFYKISFLKQHNSIKFIPGLNNGEDSLFTLETLFYTNNITIEKNTTYFYRKNSDSLVTNMNNTKYYINSIHKWLNELQSFYNKNEKSYKMKQTLLRFLAAQILYKLIRKNNFNIQEKLYITVILRDFAVNNKLGFIYFNPYYFIKDFSYLYCLFNIIIFLGLLKETFNGMFKSEDKYGKK